jgi:hypothetical protein
MPARVAPRRGKRNYKPAELVGWSIRGVCPPRNTELPS